MPMSELPHRNQLMRPVLEAIDALGGSGIVEEINRKVASSMELPDELLEKPYVTKRGKAEGRTQFEYDLAWARTYLKQLGFIQNSARGVWVLSAAGRESLAREEQPFAEEAGARILEPAETWRAELLQILREKISPAAFERLIQRVLRETGFSMVEIVGRSGDGGIDGKGIAKINGILSFRVVFQGKRYGGSVGAPAIRDFRGAMQGRADKGLFITTGAFTQEAIKEATRDGAIAIDLVDGERLVDKLRELGLGVEIEQVERVSVDSGWFEGI